MKIENLKVGQVLKNYKELCEVLGIEPKKTGSSPYKAQLKELDRYCEYHKEGHKIIIDQIYQEVKNKVDNRTLGNNNEQARCIRYLICNLLSSYKIEQDEVIGFSKALMLKKLFMTNENYVAAKYSRELYAKALEVETMAVNECLDYIENSSISAIRRAISTLKSQSVLGYKYSYSWVDHKGEHNHCTVLEENAIHLMEQEVMAQMRISKKQKIWEYGRWEEFKSKVKVKLLEEYPSLFPQLDYYYYSFHFNYAMEGIQRHMRFMEQKQGMNFETAKAGVQELWSNSLETTINNRHEKAKEKTPFGNSFNQIENYRKCEKYNKEQQKVKNSIVKLDYQKVEISQQLSFNIENIDVPF